MNPGFLALGTQGRLGFIACLKLGWLSNGRADISIRRVANTVQRPRHRRDERHKATVALGCWEAEEEGGRAAGRQAFVCQVLGKANQKRRLQIVQAAPIQQRQSLNHALACRWQYSKSRIRTWGPIIALRVLQIPWRLKSMFDPRHLRTGGYSGTRSSRSQICSRKLISLYHS